VLPLFNRFSGFGASGKPLKRFSRRNFIITQLLKLGANEIAANTLSIGGCNPQIQR
jgi:hypothetical protein